MKTLFLSVLLASHALASPYLISNAYPPQPDPTNDVVAFVISGLTDGAPIVSKAVFRDDGSQSLQYDLAALNLVSGIYVLSVVAVDAKGQRSAPATLAFSWSKQ